MVCRIKISLNIMALGVSNKVLLRADTDFWFCLILPRRDTSITLVVQNILKFFVGYGEMSQCLKAFSAIAEDWDSSLGTFIMDSLFLYVTLILGTY